MCIDQNASYLYIILMYLSLFRDAMGVQPLQSLLQLYILLCHPPDVHITLAANTSRRTSCMVADNIVCKGITKSSVDILSYFLSLLDITVLYGTSYHY